MSIPYSDELATRVLEHISEGNSARSAARLVGVPYMTLWTWMNDQKGLFVHSPRARAAGCDSLADQCIEIADDREEDAQSRRIRIDTRLRLLGKWDQRYADKVKHDVTLRKAEEMTDDELAAVAGSAGAFEAQGNPGLSD